LAISVYAAAAAAIAVTVASTTLYEECVDAVYHIAGAFILIVIIMRAVGYAVDCTPDIIRESRCFLPVGSAVNVTIITAAAAAAATTASA
jgi:hypothetical protein